jgi:hypothetical protein
MVSRLANAARLVGSDGSRGCLLLRPDDAAPWELGRLARQTAPDRRRPEPAPCDQGQASPEPEPVAFVTSPVMETNPEFFFGSGERATDITPNELPSIASQTWCATLEYRSA